MCANEPYAGSGPLSGQGAWRVWMGDTSFSRMSDRDDWHVGDNKSYYPSVSFPLV